MKVMYSPVRDRQRFIRILLCASALRVLCMCMEGWRHTLSKATLVYIHMYMHQCVCMYVCMYVCVHVCVFVHVCVCVCVCVCVRVCVR